jgi:hypothetical protein
MARAALPPPAALPEYLPARMLNEFVYCPRLTNGSRASSRTAPIRSTAGTGLERHDRREDKLPTAGDAEGIHARSVSLSSDAHGLVAKLDLIGNQRTLLQRNPTARHAGWVARAVGAAERDPERQRPASMRPVIFITG